MKSIKWILGLGGLGLGLAALYSKPAKGQAVRVHAGQWVGAYLKLAAADPLTAAEAEAAIEQGGKLEVLRVYQLTGDPRKIFLVIAKALASYTAIELDLPPEVDSEIFTADSGDDLDVKLERFLAARKLRTSDFQEVTG